jgi:stress response protein SCP2
MLIELETPYRIDDNFNLEIEFDIELNIYVEDVNDLVYYGHRHSRDGNIVLNGNKATIDLERIEATSIYIIATSAKPINTNVNYSITEGSHTELYEIDINNKNSVILAHLKKDDVWHIYKSTKTFDASDIRYIVSHLL